jgi:hypothetical protein
MTKLLDRVVTTDAEIDAAIAQSKVGPSHRAVKAFYNPDEDKIVIQLADEVEIRLPRKRLQGLEGVPVDQVSEIEIEGPGTGLYWPKLDVAHYVPGLIQGVFGTRKYMQEIGRSGGAKTSEAKAAAARENGKKGGRKASAAGPQ